MPSSAFNAQQRNLRYRDYLLDARRCYPHIRCCLSRRNPRRRPRSIIQRRTRPAGDCDLGHTQLIRELLTSARRVTMVKRNMSIPSSRIVSLALNSEERHSHAANAVVGTLVALGLAGAIKPFAHLGGGGAVITAGG